MDSPTITLDLNPPFLLSSQPSSPTWFLPPDQLLNPPCLPSSQPPPLSWSLLPNQPLNLSCPSFLHLLLRTYLRLVYNHVVSTCKGNPILNSNVMQCKKNHSFSDIFHSNMPDYLLDLVPRDLGSKIQTGCS